MTNVSFGLLSYLACELDPIKYVDNLNSKTLEECKSDFLRFARLVEKRFLVAIDITHEKPQIL